MLCILGTPAEHTSLCTCLVITSPITESGTKIIKDWNVPVMSKTSTKDCHQRKNVGSDKEKTRSKRNNDAFFSSFVNPTSRSVEVGAVICVSEVPLDGLYKYFNYYFLFINGIQQHDIFFPSKQRICLFERNSNRRSSEIQGTALGKCLQAWPVYIGPGLRG